MSYADVAEMAEDPDLTRRLYGCVASMGRPNGAMWVDRFRWQIVAVDEWVDAWSSAKAAGIERPGWDAVVITDSTILQRVAQLWEQTGAI